MTHPATGFEAAPLAPGLEFRFRIDARIAPEIPIDERGPGRLAYIPITGGTVSGALAGTLTTGGDWCTDLGDGRWRVEARYGMRLESGAYIDVHNTGVLTESKAAGAEYFMTNPVFRTVAPEAEWLNGALFVGHALELPRLIRIDVFEVVLPAGLRA